MPTSIEGPLRDRVTVSLPTGAMFTLSGSTLRVEGPQGAVSRPFPSEALELTIHPTKVDLRLKIPTNRKRAQALLHTWERHITNLAIGVTRGFEARMKVVAAHFPMKVQVRDSVLVIENFLGEKHARNASLIPGVKAQVEGEFVLLSGHDIEEVGQSAANIERATKIRDYDPRVFQDGIYIVERARPKETGS